MSYEQYTEYDNYKPTHYEPSYQHYHEFEEQGFFGELAYNSAEVGMAAHIPGLQGRAAHMGQQFHDQVWGQGHNFGLTNDNTTAKLDHALPPHATTSATIANAMQNDDDDPPITHMQPQSRLRSNPFANIMLCTQLLICCANIGTAIATLGAPRTRSAVLTSVLMLLFCISLFPDSTHAIAAPNTTFSLFDDNHYALTSTNAFGLSSTTLTAYLLDSWCSTSIITDSKYLTNIRPMIPVQIAGLSGYKILYMKADVHLPVHTAGGTAHTITVHDVFYDPDGHFNLISSDQLNASNYDVMLTADPTY